MVLPKKSLLGVFAGLLALLAVLGIVWVAYFSVPPTTPGADKPGPQPPPGTEPPPGQPGNGTPPQGREDTGPQFWFSRDDYAISDPDTDNQVAVFAVDTLSKWDNPERWSRTLDTMDVYVIQSYLFNRGRPVADAFADMCLDYPQYTLDGADDRVQQCYNEYLKRVLTVLNTYGVELAIHAGGSKGYVAENNPSGVPARTIGLAETVNLIAWINEIGSELDPPYRVGYVKLQSMLSGNPKTWEGHGLANNIVNTISFMKEVQREFPDIRFVLGDALFQKRTDEIEGPGGETQQTWRDAYRALKTALDEEVNSPGGMALKFEGIRVEWNRDWVTDPALADDTGFAELQGPNGAVEVAHGYGWRVGISHNAEKQSNDESFDSRVFENRVLTIARRSLELGIDADNVVFRNGGGYLFPKTTIPEELGPNDSPTQASIFLQLVALYDQ